MRLPNVKFAPTGLPTISEMVGMAAQAPGDRVECLSSRYVLNPLRLWDCDRPVNASAAYLFTTVERARDMRQPPVYVLNHSQHNFRQRSTQADLEQIEDWTDRAAKRMYEGAGLGPEDVDIFKPYDGYAPMTQFFLEAFQWHGVERGDAFAFYAGDIRAEGPHPLCSSGGNLGNGAPGRPCTPTA